MVFDGFLDFVLVNRFSVICLRIEYAIFSTSIGSESEFSGLECFVYPRMHLIVLSNVAKIDNISGVYLVFGYVNVIIMAYLSVYSPDNTFMR